MPSRAASSINVSGCSAASRNENADCACSSTNISHGGPDMAPKPPTFGTPRRSRGAPLERACFWGPRHGPQAPHVRHARTPTELAPGDEHAEVDDHDPEQQREAVEPTDSAEHGRRIAAGGERP